MNRVNTEPLIRELIAKLPEPDTSWGIEERRKWLVAANALFDMLYTRDEILSDEIHIDVVPR